MILLSHPTGNANVHNAALALSEAMLLQEFWTCVAVTPDSRWDRFSRIPGFGALRRRSIPEVLGQSVRQRPMRELMRILADRIGLARLTKHEVGYACIDAVCRDLDAAVSLRLLTGDAPEGVYCYEDCALETFNVARRRGITRIYDLPIGYWRVAQEIFSEEGERLPAWRSTLSGLSDSREKLERKDEELSLADGVVVASTFTAKTLDRAPFALKRPVVIPYGCALSECEMPRPELHRSSSVPLRVLFVGSLTQRKGLNEVFTAIRTMKDRATLTIVGRRVGECSERDRFLAGCHWIETAPKHEVLRLMRSHDVLVFPSLFEGFGLVITEALSQGLPVITTANTAGPDILTDGHDGFIVPVRNWEAIVSKLEVLDSDRHLLGHMRECAIKKAESLSWHGYRQRLTGIVTSILDGEHNP